MSDEKRGKFLQQLRIEKKLTQKELSEMLHYSDNAVSNWEKGKTLPNNPETLVKLSELYDVSIEELLYGERKNTRNSKMISNNMENVYKKSYKNFKTALHFSIIFLLLIVIIFFISIYFIFIKGKILSYTIQGNNEHFLIEKSSILFTDKIDILNFNKIEPLHDEKINYIKLYYTENNNEYIIFQGPNDNYYIEEPKGYGEYNLDELRKNKIFIEVNFNDDLTETINLSLSQRFINNNIFSSSIESISDRESNISDNINDNIKNFLANEGFSRNGDSYEKMEKDIRIVYNSVMNEIYLYIQSKSVYEQVQFDLSKNVLIYDYFDENTGDNISDIYTLNDIEANIPIKFINDNIDYLLYLKENLDTLKN